MTYRGHIKNGAIVLDESVELPDGAIVEIELFTEEAKMDNDGDSSLAQRYAEVMGKARSLPSDAAENHDHYLYGTPKK